MFQKPIAGGTWQPVNSGFTTFEVYALAIRPTEPYTLYAGTRKAGVFQKPMAGDTWTLFNDGLTFPSINTLMIPAAAPDVLYAGTEGGSAFTIGSSPILEVYLPVVVR